MQAESGTLGADFVSLNAGAVGYITVQTNGSAQNPESAARVVSHTVTFPAAGVYDLYARVRVGAAGASDDSFFYGNGFGTKVPTSDAEWITANNLGSVGFTAAGDTVTGGGAAGSGVWKWIKLSDFNGGEAPIQFTVPAGALTQTFQIGGREDGLDMDTFAFGRAGVTYTVAELGTEPAPQRPAAPRWRPASRSSSAARIRPARLSISPPTGTRSRRKTPGNGVPWKPRAT